MGVAFISNPGNYNVKNEKNTRIKCVCVCVCVCVWGGGVDFFKFDENGGRSEKFC